MKCRRCEKRPAQPLHYLCRECYAEDDGEPKNAGEEILRLTRERDQARAEAERWRDNFKNGRTMSMIAGTKLPWENDQDIPPRKSP